MKNDPSNIPSSIFDWLQERRFEELKPVEQQQVLTYFSQEEYNSLQHAAYGIGKMQSAKQLPERPAIKQNLMNRFDAHQAKQSVSLFNKPVAMWKAAAAMVLFASAVLLTSLITRRDVKSSVILTQTDTVYVDRQTPATPEKIYDTVYIYKERKAADNRRREMATEKQLLQEVEQNAGDIGIMSVKDIDDMMNVTRGHSMKDDSMSGRFNFISM